ncbi:disease resistance protein Roq1-like isoform X2 [Prosopis cineraria]|uniref:disease resistance protein Roq1-like isoform X2 n=1 Tax=Prosopis cineraria TaxID=364024 RepID=UPI00240EDE5F|nr:disease resistance protein Roq1-like isoform X2 [Prosopis cineraria]
MAAPGPSTASTSPMRYHVFLSFRGTDTRTNFTDHLYAALLRQGIVTFRDDVDLHKGHVIKDELLQAIEQSMFAIVVLSKNYAASSWCLDELRKILKSKKASGQTVFPVFYGIDPSDVRHQKRKFATAFEKHEVRFPDVKVRRWRKALRKIAKLSGWDTSNKHEAEIVEDIVKSVWNKLCLKLPSNFGHLVGDIQSKVDRIISLLKIGLGDKCFVGIWGMGGIGKTTLSRVVYDALQSKFEASCFLANLREDCEKSGLVYLQKKLLSGLGLREPKIDDAYDGVKKIRGFLCHKKVLIVLDDISHKSQLDNLAGTEEWFGEGSKIIMTTRDKQLLTQYEQFEEYGVGKLNEDESLKLLCHKAFKKDEPKEAYLDFSKEVVKYACGLPLALEVLGSFLCNRDPVQWRDALDKLKENLHKDIFSKLCISYEGLEDEQYRNIFLDIACLFIRTSKAEVTDILKICGLHSVIGINVLIEKSLLSTFKSQSLGNNWGSYCNVHQYMDDGLRKMRREIFIDREQLEYYYPQDHLTMHDLLQEMGRNIVLRESSDACKRSRLWRLEEIDHMLKRNKGTKKVQSICLNIAQKFKAEWHPDCFLKMENLRLLDLSGVCLSRNLNVLPSSLKFLRWDFYALKSLPSIDQLCELESLELRSSKIERLWNGAPRLDKLRIINLAESGDLIETPDFSATPNLEKLFLDDCHNLVGVHESIGQLKKLVELSLEDCVNLVKLPSCLEMNNLEVLNLRGCKKLEKLPEFGKNMTSLYLLSGWGASITEIPLSIIHLINLKFLDLYECDKLKKVPELPPNLIIAATHCDLLEPKEAVAKYLSGSRVSKCFAGSHSHFL